MGSILTHTFGTYTVFRTIHSIYENTNEVAPCIVAFTPCDDMMLSTSTMEYELQDIFDTFDYLLKNQFDLFAKSAIYEGNSSPLNISGLVDEVVEIMEKNYNLIFSLLTVWLQIKIKLRLRSWKKNITLKNKEQIKL